MLTPACMLSARVSRISDSCAPIHQYAWNVNIECLIEYPCDPLPSVNGT